MYTVCSTFKLKYTTVGTVELDSGQKLKKIQRQRESWTQFLKNYLIINFLKVPNIFLKRFNYFNVIHTVYRATNLYKI